MGMPDLLQPLYWTADMVRALPEDGLRYEVVHGELLVTPAPRGWHQELVGRLYVALRTWLDREQVGHLMLSPADISWDEGTLVQPDLFVVDLSEARTMDWARMKHLVLVIEVLSPATARADRFAKRRRYQEAGVPAYWVIDPDRHQVEIWYPDASAPLFEREELRWDPAGASRAFTLPLSDLFRPL